MVTIAQDLRPTRIEEEMRSSYMSYAMSVIVARALPDVRDGLKPVHRRILYAMNEMGITPNSAYKKCARIVGEVLGKYHPHGDAPVYEALVRMAQDFSMRYPLVDGQGNFGSIDNDPPAAMRYTEARLAAIAVEMLADIDLDTVDLVPNFDSSLQEPTVLPAKLPNMLVNGASGIAVGMATNIPPHNLTEVCTAIAYLVDHPDATLEQLLPMLPGPDFPTGGIIRGRSGILDAYRTGVGRVVMQACTEIEELKGGRSQIVITELPYQTNKAALVERIAELARDKKVEGIADVRDESDRKGISVVVELKRDGDPGRVLRALFKHTNLQTSFNVVMLALVDGQPKILNIQESLQLFIQHRQTVVTRRSRFLLKKAQERLHIVEGLRKAIEQLDLVIRLIRQAADADAARQALMDRLKLSQPQAQAILDMQLRRLAALERQKLEDEYKDLLKTISELEALLASPAKVLRLIKEETQRLKERYGDSRRTQIVDSEADDEDSLDEDVPSQDVVVTVTQRGYVKRMLPTTYRQQHRGGKGVRGMVTREGDDLQEILLANTRDTLFFFTERGRVYPVLCHKIPEATSRTTRGIPLVTFLSMEEGERGTAALVLPELTRDATLILCTRIGEIKGVALSDLANIRRRGLAIMDLEKGDQLVSVRMARKGEEVMLFTSKGISIRFPVSQVPVRSRTAGGVRGIRLTENDSCVAMEVVRPSDLLLLITRQGIGKVVGVSAHRLQNRGGKGVLTTKINNKSGPVADVKVVSQDYDEDVVLVSAKGQVSRTSITEIRQLGRYATGVKIWKPEGDDHVASIACMQRSQRNGHAPTGIMEGVQP